MVRRMREVCVISASVMERYQGILERAGSEHDEGSDFDLLLVG